MKLFERSVRPLALTASGALLRQRAILLVAEAHEVAAVVGGAANGRLFRVRMGLAGSVMKALAVKLTRLLSTHASEVAVFSEATPSHIEGIINRSVDISVSWNGMDDIDWVERHHIIGEPFILLFPASSPLAHGGLSGIADQLQFIRHSARSQSGRDVDRQLRRIGVDIPRHIEFDSPIGVTAAVADGAGWAITTPLSAYEGGLTNSITYMPFTGPDFGRRLSLPARKNDLGRLPRIIANEARQVLARDVIPSILTYMP